MSEVYIIEDKVGNWEIRRVQGIMGALRKSLGRSPAGLYAKFGTAETARTAWEHPKDIAFVVFFLSVFVTVAVAFFSPLLAILAFIAGCVLTFVTYSILKFQVRYWVIRKDNPTPMPLLDKMLADWVIRKDNPTPMADNPGITALNEQVEGVIPKIERLIDSANLRDFVQPPANLLMYLIMVALGVLVGYVLGTTISPGR